MLDCRKEKLENNSARLDCKKAMSGNSLEKSGSNSAMSVSNPPSYSLAYPVSTRLLANQQLVTLARKLGKQENIQEKGLPGNKEDLQESYSGSLAETSQATCLERTSKMEFWKERSSQVFLARLRKE
jgi:hypothetical protein